MAGSIDMFSDAFLQKSVTARDGTRWGASSLHSFWPKVDSLVFQDTEVHLTALEVLDWAALHAESPPAIRLARVAGAGVHLLSRAQTGGY